MWVSFLYMLYVQIYNIHIHTHIFICMCVCVFVYLWCACVCVSSSWARVLSFTWMWFMWSVSNLLPQVLFVHTLYVRVSLSVCVCAKRFHCGITAWFVALPMLRLMSFLFLLLLLLLLFSLPSDTNKWKYNKIRREKQSKAMTTMHCAWQSAGEQGMRRTSSCNCSYSQASPLWASRIKRLNCQLHINWLPLQPWR